MTDNDIIEALDHEIFINKSNTGNFRAYCNGVPKWILIEALDLINRQKTEIERWKKNCDELYEQMNERQKAEVKIAKRMGKAKAVKEFAEKLHEELRIYGIKDKFNKLVFLNVVDKAKKGLVGDENETKVI